MLWIRIQKEFFRAKNSFVHTKWSEVDFSLKCHFLLKEILWTVWWLITIKSSFSSKICHFLTRLFLSKTIKKSSIKIPWKLLFWLKVNVQTNRAEKSVWLRLKKISWNWIAIGPKNAGHWTENPNFWSDNSNSSFSHTNGTKMLDASNVRQQNKFERLNVVR